MATKKLNKSEIEAVAMSILSDVNAVNKEYNEKLENSKKYKEDIELIKSKSEISKLKKEVEKLIKIQFGKKAEEVEYSISLAYKSDFKEKEKLITDEVNEYKKKNLKVIYRVPTTNSDKWERGNCVEFLNICQEITIAQALTKDLQLLINSIKAKLI